VPLATLVAKAKQYGRAYAHKPERMKWPATWLQEEGWLDDPQPPRPKGTKPQAAKAAKAAKANGSKAPTKTKSSKEPKSELQLWFPVGTIVKDLTTPVRGEVIGHSGNRVDIRWATGVERSELLEDFEKYDPQREAEIAAQREAERAAAKAWQEKRDRERAEAKAKQEQLDKRRREWHQRWLKQRWEKDDWGEFCATMEGFSIRIHENETEDWRGAVRHGNWGEVTAEGYPTFQGARDAAIDLLLDRAGAAP
jgi:hypothetical protein